MLNNGTGLIERKSAASGVDILKADSAFTESNLRREATFINFYFIFVNSNLIIGIRVFDNLSWNQLPSSTFEKIGATSFLLPPRGPFDSYYTF